MEELVSCSLTGWRISFVELSCMDRASFYIVWIELLFTYFWVVEDYFRYGYSKLCVFLFCS